MKNPILLTDNSRNIIFAFAKKLTENSDAAKSLNAKLKKATDVVKRKVILARDRQFPAAEIKTLKDYGHCDENNGLVVIFKKTDGTGPTEWLPCNDTWHPKPIPGHDQAPEKGYVINSVFNGPLHIAFKEYQAFVNKRHRDIDYSITLYEELIRSATYLHQVVEAFPEAAELEDIVSLDEPPAISEAIIAQVKKAVSERLKK